MVSGIGAALSGLTASATRLTTAAEHIAQAGTAAACSPVKAPQTNQATPEVAAPPDPAQDLINATIASYDFRANLTSLKAQDTLQKHTLDMIA